MSALAIKSLAAISGVRRWTRSSKPTRSAAAPAESASDASTELTPARAAMSLIETVKKDSRI